MGCENRTVSIVSSCPIEQLLIKRKGINEKIYLVRHGEPTETGVYLGISDIELSPAGRDQIRRTGSLLRSVIFTKVFCSPRIRCRKSLELMDISTSPIIDERLSEINFGNWEKMTFTDIQERFPDEVKMWAEKEDLFTFPEGESILSFRRRVEDFYNFLLCMQEEGSFLIVTHGGVVRHLICLFLHIPISNHMLFQIDYAGLTCVDLFKEGGVLTALNR